MTTRRSDAPVAERNGAKRSSRAFTLVELLVVVAIIGILIAVLIPVIGTAMERGRQADCISNLRQFAVMIMTYRNDQESNRNFDEGAYKPPIPPWLSTLYGTYHSSKSLYLCRSDRSGGADGSRPDVGPTEVTKDQFAETDDTEFNTSASALPANARRNTQITRCSYMYEFCAATCGWTRWSTDLARTPLTGADVDLDGDPSRTSWAEVKFYQMNHGDGWHNYEPYGETYFPMIRCFNHYRIMVEAKGEETGGSGGSIINLDTATHKERLTLNVAYAGNVFSAPLTWELAK